MYHSLIIGIEFMYDNKCSVDIGSDTLFIKKGLFNTKMTGCVKTNIPIWLVAREEINFLVNLRKCFKGETVRTRSHRQKII